MMTQVYFSVAPIALTLALIAITRPGPYFRLIPGAIYV